MGGISTDSVLFAVDRMPVRCPFLGGAWNVWGPARGGYLLAHCWVLRQQDLCLAAMRGGGRLVSSCSRIFSEAVHVVCVVEVGDGVVV
jgi:hypothetical protein